MMLVVIPREKLGAESVRILVTAKPIGKLRTVLHGLELALRIRIVLETYGRLWVLVTPSSARKKATTFDLIGAPRSACTVRVPGQMLWRSIVCSMSFLANSADSRYPSIQPTT